MTHQELFADLQAWASEFSSITGTKDPVPRTFLEFIARRLVDAGLGQENHDVVRIKLWNGEVNRCRITGLHDSGRIYYTHADTGRYGTGLCVPDDVLQEDKPKLAEILDRLSSI